MSKQDKHEWRLTTWPDGHQCEKHYVNGQYVGEWRTLEGRTFKDSDTVTGNKAQHSPLPWTMLANSIVTVGIPGQGAIATLGEKDREGGLHLSPEIAESNAKLIVASVNHAARLAEALRECITEQGAMSERSHYNAKRRLQYITDTARLALAAYEAAQ
jgi:hypothetical protein